MFDRKFGQSLNSSFISLVNINFRGSAEEGKLLENETWRELNKINYYNCYCYCLYPFVDICLFSKYIFYKG